LEKSLRARWGRPKGLLVFRFQRPAINLAPRPCLWELSAAGSAGNVRKMRSGGIEDNGFRGALLGEPVLAERTSRFQTPAGESPRSKRAQGPGIKSINIREPSILRWGEREPAQPKRLSLAPAKRESDAGGPPEKSKPEEDLKGTESWRGRRARVRGGRGKA